MVSGQRRNLVPSSAQAAVLVSLLGTLLLYGETHSNLQAVTSVGLSAWTGTLPFTVQGVLLTDPEEMLDSTPDFQPATAGTMGGEWQIVIQSTAPGDRGGTTCWMGQNYALRRPPFADEFSYTNEQWTNEIHRLNHDPLTGHAFRKGDRVEVTASRSLFFGGKRNINEAHDNDPSADFTISLVASNYGLPAPEVISLMSVMHPDDGDPATSEDIFDPTRATGGEYYQGVRVRLTELTLVDTNGWNATNPWSDRKCKVTDSENRWFTLRHPHYDLGPPPAGRFDVIGVFTQESGSGVQGTNGYELFVQEVSASDEAVLTIAPTARGVNVSWPGSLQNYELLSAASPGGPVWTPVEEPPVVVGDRNRVTVPWTNSQGYFRLERVR